jgi:LysM repeat protein
MMRLLVIFFCSLAVAQGVAAQQFVRISNTEITDKGKTYLLHTVSKGETIYGLCRAYNITESTLMTHNPAIKNGLQQGQQLKIPKKTSTAADKPKSKQRTTPPKNADQYAYHIVKAGETLYSIARRYGINVKDLHTMNSDLESNYLYEGRILRVPKENTVAEPLVATAPHNHSAATENVEQTEQIEQTEQKPASSNSSNMTASVATPVYEPVSVPDFCNNVRPYDKVINIALLLPFGVSGYDRSEMQRSFEFAEFYEGTLIALERLKRQGARIKLYVWDVDATNIKKILANSAFHDMSLIIGPVYPELFSIAAELARERSIPIISPLAATDSAQHDNRYVFQVALSDEFLTEKLLQHCLTDTRDVNVVFITHKDAPDGQEMERLYRRHLPNLSATIYHNRNAQLDSLRLSVLIGEYEKRAYSSQIKQIQYQTGILPRGNHETFLRTLVRNTPNRIIIASDDEPFVNEVMANLKAFSDFYGCYIEAYGTSKWRKFENIELETYYNLNLHIATSYFVDYQAEHTIDFIRRYRSQYKTEPNQMAFQGYDIATYFAGAFYRYGHRFEECLPAYSVDLLHSKYFFNITEYFSRQNEGGFLIRYVPETIKIVPYK